VACVDDEGFGDSDFAGAFVAFPPAFVAACELARGDCARAAGAVRAADLVCAAAAELPGVAAAFPFPFPVERCCWPVAEPRELRATADVLRPGADAERPGETVGAFAFRVPVGGVSADGEPPATVGGADGVSLPVAGRDAGGAVPAVVGVATLGTLLVGGVVPEGTSGLQLAPADASAEPAGGTLAGLVFVALRSANRPDVVGLDTGDAPGARPVTDELARDTWGGGVRSSCTRAVAPPSVATNAIGRAAFAARPDVPARRATPVARRSRKNGAKTRPSAEWKGVWPPETLFLARCNVEVTAATVMPSSLAISS
jgi:hypothetical protein